MNHQSLSLEKLAHLVQGECVGQRDLKLSGLASLEHAGAQHLAFVNADKYLEPAGASKAGALIVTEALKAQILFNGKAVPNVEVDVFKGAGSLDAEKTKELPAVKSNAKGEIEVKFEKAGIYLITAAYPEANPDNTKKPQAESFTYGLTVEVAE